jgi:hypothetical protein
MANPLDPLNRLQMEVSFGSELKKPQASVFQTLGPNHFTEVELSLSLSQPVLS